MTRMMKRKDDRERQNGRTIGDMESMRVLNSILFIGVICG